MSSRRPLLFPVNQADRSRRFIDVLVRVRPCRSFRSRSRSARHRAAVPETRAVHALVGLQDELGAGREGVASLLSASGWCGHRRRPRGHLLRRSHGRQRECRAHAPAASRALDLQLLTEACAVAGRRGRRPLVARCALAALRSGAGRIPRRGISLDAVLAFTLVRSLATGVCSSCARAVRRARRRGRVLKEAAAGSRGSAAAPPWWSRSRASADAAVGASLFLDLRTTPPVEARIREDRL